MNQPAHRPQAFIRPSPTDRHLGGAEEREAMLLCEAFGFDIIIIELWGLVSQRLA